MMLPQSHDRVRPGARMVTTVVSLVLTLLYTQGCATAANQTEPPVVRVGLDRITDELRDVLLDKRVALVVHAASVTVDGRHAIDALRSAGIDVTRILTPEHGLRGQAAAGEHVAHGRDVSSGLPVISLYGKQTKPTTMDLQDIDALVFDLQGAGVRFYTYLSTLIRCLEAAAENNVEIVVLDRPNPLGGVRIEGPAPASRSEVAASFVNLAPGPLVHGLTLGEMARYVNRTLPRSARLSVVPMLGWHRNMTWNDTGRTWVPPSPNLRSAEAALAYPGVALVEATNASEGRGTDAPFLRFGAPWLTAEAAQTIASTRVPGFTLTPTSFTPHADATAPAPKHQDLACTGLQVTITDANAAQPYRLGVALLQVLSIQPGFVWRDDGAALTRLLGTPTLLTALRNGSTVQEIIDTDSKVHAWWREERRRALLYPER